MSTITIIGAGMMGTALCWPLADNHHTVRLVGTPVDDGIITAIRQTRVHPKLQRPVPERVQAFFHTDIPEAVEGADILVSGVSSFGVNWLADTVGPYMRPEVPVIAVTKGLEDQPNGDLRILPDVIDDHLPVHLRGRIKLNAIGGPCIAHELAARRHTGVVFCGRNVAALTFVRNVFRTRYYHVRISTDIVGVEACAALKNSYALAVCLAIGQYDVCGDDNLARMVNPQAALFAQSTLEMQRLLYVMNGSTDNVVSLPGAGDLYVTVFAGRTARLGRLLGQGLSYAEARAHLSGETLESVEIITRVARAIPKLEARGLVRPGAFPLLMHLDQVICHGAAIDIPWEQFFADHVFEDVDIVGSPHA